MGKRLIDIDDELLAAAQEITGQATMKGTVATALRRLVDEHERREDALRQRWSRLGDAMVDLHDEDVMRGAWS